MVYRIFKNQILNNTVTFLFGKFLKLHCKKKNEYILLIHVDLIIFSIIKMADISFQSLKGIEVKLKYGPLYKIMKKDLCHKGFQYKYGMNIDTKEFKLGGFCSGHGLYFSNFQHIHNFLFYGSMIAEVSVLDDDDVWMETDRNGLKSFKSHRLIIVDIKPIQQHTKNLIIFDILLCKISKIKSSFRMLCIA
jgi:hypothetical protein